MERGHGRDEPRQVVHGRVAAKYGDDLLQSHAVEERRDIRGAPLELKVRRGDRDREKPSAYEPPAKLFLYQPPTGAGATTSPPALPLLLPPPPLPPLRAPLPTAPPPLWPPPLRPSLRVRELNPGHPCDRRIY